MHNGRKTPRIDRFDLIHVLSITAIVAVLLALIRMMFGSGLMKPSLFFLAGFLVIALIFSLNVTGWC